MNDKINVELIIKKSRKKQQNKDTLDFRELANDIIEKYPVEEYDYDDEYDDEYDEDYEDYEDEYDENNDYVDDEQYHEDDDNDDEKPTFTYLSKNE